MSGEIQTRNSLPKIYEVLWNTVEVAWSNLLLSSYFYRVNHFYSTKFELFVDGQTCANTFRPHSLIWERLFADLKEVSTSTKITTPSVKPIKFEIGCSIIVQTSWKPLRSVWIECNRKFMESVENWNSATFDFQQKWLKSSITRGVEQDRPCQLWKIGSLYS